jgi:hypothetical protein
MATSKRPGLLAYKDYNFHKLRDLASCRVFRTADGSQLIVPCWEVLRAWYLISPNVMPAILAGAMSHPREAMPPAHRLWLDGTERIDDATVCYRIPRWVTDDQAKRLARLFFDPVARQRCYAVYSDLMESRRTVEHTQYAELPCALAPYRGTAPWTVRCRPVSPSPDGAHRWLVTELLGAAAPLPFEAFIADRENDASQGENKDDPGLEPYRAPQRSPVAGLDEATLQLTRLGPDRTLLPAVVDGFEFDDHAAKAVRIIPVEKLLQVSRAVGGQGFAQQVEGGATDYSAPARPGHIPVELAEPSVPPLSHDDLLQRTIAAFHLVIEEFAKDPSTIAARLISNTAQDTFHAASRRQRHFVILEVSKGNRTVYAIEAQRRESRSLPLTLCRSVDFRPIGPSQFSRWFVKFPGRDSAWFGQEVAPPGILGERFIHQTRRPTQALRTIADERHRRVAEESHHVSALALRLEAKLRALLASDGQSNAQRR